MNRSMPPRLAALEAQAARHNPLARLEADAQRLSPETRRAQIGELWERLGPDGVARALARGGAEGRRLAAKLGVEL
jgi:hypothetical protein